MLELSSSAEHRPLRIGRPSDYTPTAAAKGCSERVASYENDPGQANMHRLGRAGVGPCSSGSPRRPYSGDLSLSLLTLAQPVCKNHLL